MFKIHQPWNHPELLKGNDGMLAFSIPDPTSGQIKKASNSTITEDMLLAAKPDADHVLIHLVALGDEEAYGPNRNADGYPKSANVAYHPTFVSHAMLFQEHQNKDPKKNIGCVKAAAYNPDMHRVELAVWLNKDRAPKEFQMAKEGKQLSFSMACKIPYDVCSCCGNQAVTPADYCEHMKFARLQWVPQHEKFAYVSNPIVTFVDISEVKHPADRIAHYLGYEFGSEMEKAASEGRSRVVLGTELAGIYKVADLGPTFFSIQKQAVFRELLAMEKALQNDAGSNAFLKLAAQHGFDGTPIEADHLEALRSAQPGTVFYKLAKKQTPLSFLDFCAYVTGKQASEIREEAGFKQACSCMLPNLFGSMETAPPDEKMEGLFDASDAYSVACDPSDKDVLDKALSVLTNRHGVSEFPARKRMLSITFKQGSWERSNVIESAREKVASDYADLVHAYGFYKVSFCSDVCRLHGTEGADDRFYALVVAQNVNEPSIPI